MKILIVDDFSTMRRIIKNLLKELGFSNTYEADDGNTALPLLKSGDFDFLMTDWNMPGMTGVEALAMIRATRPDVPIVICTGLIDRDVDAALAASTGVSVLIKPYTTRELLATLQASCP